jgi:hypothetical protein
MDVPGGAALAALTVEDAHVMALQSRKEVTAPNSPLLVEFIRGLRAETHF